MNPAALLALGVNPGLALLAGFPGGLAIASDNRARVLLLAIAGQESGLMARRQMGNGPARGFWQFEQQDEKTRGGVWGVMHHEAVKRPILRACAELAVPGSVEGVWRAIEFNDHLAAILARCLLYTDPRPLPPSEDPDAGWAYYLRNWRPGKPKPDAWAAHHRAAREAVAALRA